MKTIKFKSIIIAAIALIGFAGNVMAQRDITSTYITNATLSDGTNGWTKTFTKNVQTNDPADAFSNSVRGNNTVGYASEAYAGWGSLIQTAYSMKQTITLPKGNYRLVNYSFFRQGEAYNTNSSKSLAYLKAGNEQVALKTLGSINAAGYANSQAEGANCFDAKMYRNTLEFSIASDNTAIEIGIEGTFDEMRSWCIVGMFELFDLDDLASVSSPTDVTYAITNPGFEYRNLTGWTNNITKGNNTYGNNNNFSSKAGIGFYESWNNNVALGDAGTLTQTLTNMPAGLYELSVYAQNIEQYNSNAAGTGMFVTANSNQTEIGANGQYKVRTTLQTDGDLTIGIKLENCTGNWIAIDRFGLQFYGDPLQAFKDLLDEKVAEAQALVDGGTLRTGAAGQLQTIINNNDNDDDAFTTEEEFNTAVSNIEAGVTQANAIAARYSVFDAEKSKWEALKAGVPSCSSLTTFESAVSTANTAVTNATSVEDVNTQIAALRPAAMTFITTTDDHLFDLTFLASTAAADWQTASGLNAAATAPAWSVPKPDASMADFVESYTEAAGGESITGNILYQTMSGMPAGYYTVALYAAASYTPNRGSLTQQCTDGQPNITFGFAGENTLSLPVVHRTQLTAADQVPVNLSVQLASSGDLTFGIKKTAAGSNWHVAQIYTITYSKDPDLTILKADRDALVSEAEGVLASADASLLTTEQQEALSAAITTANSANTYDALTTVTLTTLPNAIQTARQQIQQVKNNRVLMIAALERFENDYNLADGTDYRRVTMSAKAWTDLLDAVDDVTTALDDVSQAASYGTLKDALVSKMNATDASLRLFKSYKAMVDGTTALGIVGDYAANSNMDTDATQEAAITALNTAFNSYAVAQTEDFIAGAFLGENLDFSAAAGSVINGENSNTIKNVTGWEVDYADADTWAVLQTDQNDNAGKLYIRKNWGSSATTLEVFKEKMLPVGKYRLSLSWNSDMANMTNKSQYKLGEAATAIGEATDGAQTLTYYFEVTDAATPFDLTIGFQKTGTGNTPAMIIVDDIVLTYLQSTLQLANNADNSSAIATAEANSDRTYNVTLQGRTLYKDGDWNTLCLPFDLNDGDANESDGGADGNALTDTPLAGCTLMELDTDGYYDSKQTGFEPETSTLYLFFKPAYTITAGKPYIIKWENGDALVNPVFTDVTINGTEINIETTDVDFKGSFSPVPFTADDKTVLFLGAENKLYWPSDNMTLKSCRCYFQLKGLQVGEITNARLFFGNEETTGVHFINNEKTAIGNDEWYTIDGSTLQSQPTKKGIYIHQGKKVVIK